MIESIFYMWRATHDQKWRDMGWQMWWVGGQGRAGEREQQQPREWAGNSQVSGLHHATF